MTRPRPGIELADDERFAALLDIAIEKLERYQTPAPYNGIESVIETLRFVRDGIERRFSPPKKSGGDQ